MDTGRWARFGNSYRKSVPDLKIFVLKWHNWPLFCFFSLKRNKTLHNFTQLTHKGRQMNIYLRNEYHSLKDLSQKSPYWPIFLFSSLKSEAFLQFRQSHVFKADLAWIFGSLPPLLKIRHN